MTHRFSRPGDKVAAALLAKPRPDTVPDVIALMNALLTCLRLTEGEIDGVVAFVQLYLMVTTALHNAPLTTWANPRFVDRIIVRFANLFFDALDAWYHRPDTTPCAWLPLFERRYLPGIEPVRFALAGVVAHICFDLSRAIVEACQDVGTTPQRGSKEEHDHNIINETLYRVEIDAIKQLATGWIRWISDRVSPYDRDGMMKLIRLTRDQAWKDAEEYYYLSLTDPKACKAFVQKLDKRTGRAAQLLVTRLPS